jgi:hypothetical protein
MSDVFTKRRPMIDLDEFERRLCRPCSTDPTDGEPLAELAELLRIIESHETDLEPPLSAGARQDAGEPGESNQPDATVRLVGGDFAAIEAGLLGTKQPRAAIPPETEQSTVEDQRPNSNARAPLISGDFAAIEAGLLGIPREQATATVSEANMSNALSTGDIGSQRFVPQDNPGVADGQNRSRRPLYAMAAIVIVAMAGIAVGFGVKSRASGPPEIASIKAESGAAKLPMAIASGADDQGQVADIRSKPPEPSPMAVVNGPERTLGLPQVEEKTPPAESHAQADNRPPAVPSAPAQMQTQTPTEPLSTAALGPEKMKTDLLRPDATPPNDTLPQANINAAPLPAPQSPAAAKASRAKAVGRAAKPQKPTAAKEPGGQPRQIANKAKALPVSRPDSEPGPIVDPKAVTPATQPSPPTNGAFGIVQSAVNSLTGATAKLLEWGRIETGSRP